MYMNSQQIVLTLGILYMFSIRNGKCMQGVLNKVITEKVYMQI